MLIHKRKNSIITFIVGLLSYIYISTAIASNINPWLILLLDDVINRPSSLIVSNSDSSSVTLNWTDASTTEIGFSIYMATSQLGTYSYVDSVSANTTTYLVAGLFSSTTYWFKITSYSTDGESAFSNLVSSTTLPAEGILGISKWDSGDFYSE